MAVETVETKATNGKASKKPVKRKVGRPRKGDTTPRYPNLRDDLIKLFTDNPTSEHNVRTITDIFPEVSPFAAAYHLAALRKKRIIQQKVERGPYSLAPASHRAGIEAAPLAVATPTKVASAERRVSPALDEIVPTDAYTRRHLQRIEQRLNEAHEFDIEFLRRLAR